MQYQLFDEIIKTGGHFLPKAHRNAVLLKITSNPQNLFSTYWNINKYMKISIQTCLSILNASMLPSSIPME